MSGTITTARGHSWSLSKEDLIPALQASALPTARVDELAVGFRELVKDDIVAIAETVPPPAHQHFDTLIDHVIAAHTSVIVATATVTGATLDQFVLCAAPGLFLIAQGYVSALNQVTLLVRNNSNGNFTLPAGSRITYILV